jgi:polyisoprenyl-teichoic acid--peptidoglycan teichoic acid transferase
VRRLTPVLAMAIVLVLTANLAVANEHLRAVARPGWDKERTLVILVIGSDWGAPRPGSPLEGRADGIHLIAVDTRRHRAPIVNIPRDSMVGGQKVNAHLALGGPGRLKSQMASYTGLDIDYFALTSFRGLRTMVRQMGGVRITLDRPIRDSASRANLRGGKQKLSGADALAFTRARKTVPGGDFTRSKHHGQLLRAAHRQIRQRQSDLPTLTRLVGLFARNTQTDIPPHQLMRLASLAVNIKPRNVRQVPLSGPTGFAGSQSVVFLRPGSTFTDIKRGRIGR